MSYRNLSRDINIFSFSTGVVEKLRWLLATFVLLCFIWIVLIPPLFVCQLANGCVLLIHKILYVFFLSDYLFGLHCHSLNIYFAGIQTVI